MSERDSSAADGGDAARTSAADGGDAARAGESTGPSRGQDLTYKADKATSGRLGAYTIDFVLLSVVAVVVFFVVVLALGALVQATPGGLSADSTAGMVASLAAVAVIWGGIGLVVFGYLAGLDATGGTIGKRVMSIEVVDTDGGEAGLTETAIRTAVLLAPLPVMAVVWTLLFGVSVLLAFFVAVCIMFAWLAVEAGVMLVSDSSQRLGDKLAGTYVIRD